MTYSQITKEYLIDCEARMQGGTVQEKLSHYKEFATFLKQDVFIDVITPQLAKTYIAETNQQHGAKGANRRLQTLKACWNWHKGNIPNNPWSLVQPYPEEDYIKYVPNNEDVGKVLNIAESWEKEILLFLLSTGARIGELFNLKWIDVNFERSTIILWTRKRKGGNRQSRLMPMGGKMRNILESLSENKVDNAEFVFINSRTGQPYHKLQPCVRYMLKRLCQTAQVKEFGFHALRHFVATQLMSSQQVNIAEIQQLLGHQRTTTTDLYLRSLSSNISHLADIIDSMVIPNNK